MRRENAGDFALLLFYACWFSYNRLTPGASRIPPSPSIFEPAHSPVGPNGMGPIAATRSVPFHPHSGVFSPVNLLCNYAAQLSEEPLRGTIDQIIHRSRLI